MDEHVGKTVKAITSEQWTGRDTFGDQVTWEVQVVEFTDGTTLSTAVDTTEVYDARRTAAA